MSKKIEALLKQVADAAGEVVDTITAIDEKIRVLGAQRQALGDAWVTKSEFLEYVARSLDRQAGNIGAKIKIELEKKDRSFFSMERENWKFPALVGDAFVPLVITEDAAYWYLKPAIMARMEELANSMNFADSGEAVPVADRRAMINQIDAEIKELRAERATLASQLQAAGITG